MSNFFNKDNFVVDLHFFGLSFAIWLVLFVIFEKSGQLLDPTHLLLFGAASLISLVLLYSFESVDKLRLGPQRRDILHMTLAFLISMIVCNLVLKLSLHVLPIANLDRVSIASFCQMTSVPLATFFYGSYCLISFYIFRNDRKKRVLLDLNHGQRLSLVPDLARLGFDKYMEFLEPADLKKYIHSGFLSKIDLIIISRDKVKQFDLEGSLLQAHLAGIPIIDASEITSRVAGRVLLDQTDLSSYLLCATQKTQLCRILLRIKYILEPVAAVALSILLSPILLIVALLVKLTSPGPIFYRQIRTGYLGKPFELVKFRSMVVDAEVNGPQWSTSNDARVTSFGHFLRRTRIDELPQLWNVMRTEISFIGPRPERPEIYEQLKSQVPLFSLRTLVRPGITGYAQVCSGYAASSAESLLKLEYDLFYIQHMSLRFDLSILVKTFKVVFVGDKANPKVVPSTSQPLAVSQ